MVVGVRIGSGNKSFRLSDQIDTIKDTAFKQGYEAGFESGSLSGQAEGRKAGFQKAMTINNLDKSQHLWFPKLYENNDWDNKISKDGLQITSLCKIPNQRAKYLDKIMDEETERITFPRVRDNLGFVFYRFKGIFKIDKELSSLETGVIFKRIKTEAFTG